MRYVHLPPLVLRLAVYRGRLTQRRRRTQKTSLTPRRRQTRQTHCIRACLSSDPAPAQSTFSGHPTARCLNPLPQSLAQNAPR